MTGLERELLARIEELEQQVETLTKEKNSLASCLDGICGDMLSFLTMMVQQNKEEE